MNIISATDLASYLETDQTPAFDLKVELANGIVSDAFAGKQMTFPLPSRVRAITLEAAARAVRNANGYSSETIDDYTYRRDAATRAAGVYLTDGEREELLGLITRRRRGTTYTVGLASPLDIE